MIAEARAILAVAAERGSLDGARARAFARACLERDPVGRLALGVLDGGPFAAARLVELAARLAEEAGNDRGACEDQERAAVNDPTDPTVNEQRTHVHKKERSR